MFPAGLLEGGQAADHLPGPGLVHPPPGPGGDPRTALHLAGLPGERDLAGLRARAGENAGRSARLNTGTTVCRTSVTAGHQRSSSATLVPRAT